MCYMRKSSNLYHIVIEHNTVVIFYYKVLRDSVKYDVFRGAK